MDNQEPIASLEQELRKYSDIRDVGSIELVPDSKIPKWMPDGVFECRVAFNTFPDHWGSMDGYLDDDGYVHFRSYRHEDQWKMLVFNPDYLDEAA